MKIAIIGAGITGLSAAQHLTHRGIDVVIFDKARGKGGRLTTKRLDMGAVNIGAQYFTAKSDAFIEQTQQWIQDRKAGQWHFTPHKVTNNKLIASPDTQKRYVGSNGMRSLTHALSSGLNIVNNTRIIQIETTTEHAHTLIDDNHQAYTGFDWVISTLPAEQAKVLFEDIPTINNQIETDIHAPCCAVTLATSGHVDKSIQGIFGDSVVAWVSRLSSQPLWEKPSHAPFDDVWEVHFTPKWSNANHTLPNKDIILQAQKWLENSTDTSLTLEDSYYHFWKYANLNHKDAIHNPAICNHLKLAATGAWCFGGRVEGGYLAGINIANTIENEQRDARS